ncbi:MAG: glycosyltransferase family 4 protein [Weeksellaceae bacterium]
MKKIGIDARLYFQTGVGVYLRNFLHYLLQAVPAETMFYLYVLPEDRSKITIEHPQFTIRTVAARWHSVAEQTVFYQALMADNLDLMHFTYFSYPVLYKRPFIATIHDVTPILFKTGKASTRSPVFYEIKHQAFKHVLSEQVKNAKAIITPTKTVKKQLVELYGKNVADKITPIYEGVNYELLKTKPNNELTKQFEKKKLIYIGNFYPHKNVERLIEGFSDMQRQDETGDLLKYELVLIGPDNHFSDVLKRMIGLDSIINVKFYHNATNEDLVFFYQHAEALINPSLSEGFGLPLIEATYFGTPVIASDIAVFHELLGEAYTSFDPTSKTAITNSIKSFIQTSKHPKVELSEMYSFEAMTAETMKLYKKLS